MEIIDLELYPLELPTTGRSGPIRSTLLRLVTDTSLEGWGEADLDWRAAELPSRRDALLAALSGRSVFDIEEITRQDVLHDPALRCAVEIACWDLVGRAVGQPVCNLLGGTFRPRVPLAARIEEGQPDETALVARELADRGIHVQIVTLTGDRARDVAVLAEVNSVTHSRVELWVDGAGSYSVDAAVELCAGLESAPPRVLIDPVDQADAAHLDRLAQQTGIALGACRSLGGPSDVMRAVRARHLAMVVIDLHAVGGILAARRCAAVADAAAVPSALRVASATGPALAAALQVAAATPSFASGVDCSYHTLGDDVLAERLEIVDGLATVPQDSGLGLAVDRAKIDQFLRG